MLCITEVFAQNRTVTGTVTAKDDGLPIPGVSVKIKGTNTGVQTGTNGKFTISVPAGGTLVFSYIGFEQQSIIVGAKSVLSVVLVTQATNIGEVVITTTLGIKHSEKEIGSSVGTVSAKELTETNVTNVANGLTAKIAGLGIYTLDNSIDPNVSIVLRGNRSLEGDNSALIVLDGVPIPGASLSSINPNDVADVTVLKGAGAAALYGSEASNGAVVITTKRGSSTAKPIISYGQSYQLENIAYYPKIQNQFGQYGGEPNYIDPLTGFTEDVPYENQLYGPAFNGSTVKLGAPLDSLTGTQLYIKYSPYKTNPIKAFFNTGFTEQNDISYQQGDGKNSFFMSAQNVYKTGIVPNDVNKKNAFSVRGHNTFSIFSVDYSVGYTKTNVSTYNGNVFPLVMQLPADLNIKLFSDPNGANSIGNASNFYDSYATNPYQIVDDDRKNYQRDQILSNLKLKLAPTEWLDIDYQLSGTFGFYQERDTNQEQDFSAYSVSDPLHSGNIPSSFSSGKEPGYVNDYSQYGDGTLDNNGYNGYNRFEGDATINLHHNFFKDFKTSLLLGNTVFQNYQKDMDINSSDLLLNGFYNVNTIGGLINAGEASYMIRQIAYFGAFGLTYKYLTLNATYRNEEDSRLSKAERSFNYPSGTLAFIPTDAIPGLKNSPILNYAKIYGSLSQVGNINIGPYEINNTYNLASGFPYGALGGLSASTTAYSPTLKPEITNAFEVGTELSFFSSRVGLNLTYYNEHDKNQTVPIQTSITTGDNFSVVNIGETQSKGEEVQFTGQVFTQAANKFGWTVGANFAKNDSKVISLLPGVNTLSLGNSQYAVVGQPFPLLEGTDFARDPQGRVIVDGTSGYPTTNNTTLTNFGRTTPEYNLGLTTNLSYKFISISAVAEYRGGDVVYNQIGQTFTFAGSSALTTEAGRERFIFPNSSIETSPGVYTANKSISVANGNYGFWQGSQFPSTMSPYVTSGAFWKLREVNISFKLDQFVKSSKFIKSATFSLTGRNLFLWAPKDNIWSDPEFANINTSSNLRGVSTDNITPGTRVFGGDLKVTF